jgi:hypothetical protein
METQCVKCSKTGSLLVITKPENIEKLDNGGSMTINDITNEGDFHHSWSLEE